MSSRMSSLSARAWVFSSHTAGTPFFARAFMRCRFKYTEPIKLGADEPHAVPARVSGIANAREGHERTTPAAHPVRRVGLGHRPAVDGDDGGGDVVTVETRREADHAGA